MSVSRTVLWSMLAMLVPVVAAQAETQTPRFSDHLQPMNDPYTDDPLGYDEAVRRVLLAGQPAAAELQMLILPSYPSHAVEELVAVRAKGTELVVEHVKLKDPLWKAVSQERERLRQKGVHAAKDIAAALASVNVAARRTAAPIDGALLAALKGVWNDRLVDSVRWGPSRGRVLDGVRFQFAGRTADGRYRWATVTSPPGGSRCGRLIAIAEALSAFADASPADRPPIARKILEDAGALREELVDPRRDDLDDR